MIEQRALASSCIFYSVSTSNFVEMSKFIFLYDDVDLTSFDFSAGLPIPDIFLSDTKF